MMTEVPPEHAHLSYGTQDTAPAPIRSKSWLRKVAEWTGPNLFDSASVALLCYGSYELCQWATCKAINALSFSGPDGAEQCIAKIIDVAKTSLDAGSCDLSPNAPIGILVAALIPIVASYAHRQIVIHNARKSLDPDRVRLLELTPSLKKVLEHRSWNDLAFKVSRSVYNTSKYLLMPALAMINGCVYGTAYFSRTSTAMNSTVQNAADGIFGSFSQGACSSVDQDAVNEAIDTAQMSADWKAGLLAFSSTLSGALILSCLAAGPTYAPLQLRRLKHQPSAPQDGAMTGDS